MPSSLFQRVDFVMHSGGVGRWKIECDNLTDADIDALALMLTEVLPPFGPVHGVPRGGTRIATALTPYATEGPLLIVDDVLTTGRSMDEVRRANRLGTPIGAVLFARGPCPGWITPLFQMPTARGGEGSVSE